MAGRVNEMAGLVDFMREIFPKVWAVYVGGTILVFLFIAAIVVIGIVSYRRLEAKSREAAKKRELARKWTRERMNAMYRSAFAAWHRSEDDD